MSRLPLLVIVTLFLSGIAYGQSVPVPSLLVRGTVADKATGEPLYFASIIRNQNVGTTSDAEGFFAIRINRQEVLSVTYIGYKSTTIKVPADFAGVEYQTEVLLEKSVTRLGTVNVRPLTEEGFKEEFMQLQVETEEEKNARDNISLIRAQGILGVIPQMDGFDNYRNFVNGPQGVSFFSTGPNKGLLRGLKKAVKSYKNSSPSRRSTSSSLVPKDKWYFQKSVPPPTRPDTTWQPLVDSLRQK